MPVHKPSPPDAIRRALVAGVADFVDKRDPLRRVLLQAPIGLHVFTLGLDDILGKLPTEVETAKVPGDAEKILGLTKSAGWRFLATGPSGAIAGDVTLASTGKPARMTSLSRDPLIAKAIQATNEVDTLPEVQKKHYELRVLRIPGILLEAFWLKSLIDDIDLFVPVLTRSTKFEKLRPYTLQELLLIGRELAEEFRAFEKENGYGEYKK